MKFVDMSQNPPVEVTVLTLRDIAFKINESENSTYSGYARISILQKWHDNPEMETPAPDFSLGEVEYWKPERVTEWDALYAKEIEREEERKVQRLLADSVTKHALIEALIDKAEEVSLRNARCYNHNRGNSMRDGRQRILELEGAESFVKMLLGDSAMTKEQNGRFNEHIRAAKSSVKMQ